MTAIAELKQVHRATWATGGAGRRRGDRRGATARPARPRAGEAWPGRARRGHRHREHRDPGRRCRRACRRPRPDSRAVRDSTPTGSAARSGRRLDRGRRRGASVRGRELRPRAVRVRRPVRTASRRRRTGSWRLPAGGLIGLVNWTPEGQVGEMLKLMGRTCRRRPTTPPRRRFGETRGTSAACSPTAWQLEFTRGQSPWRFDSPSTTSCSWRPTTAQWSRPASASPRRVAGRSAAARSLRWPSAATKPPTATS